MRIYIPTLNRQDKICTHLTLGDAFDYYIVVHDPLQLYQYKQNKTIPPERLICSYAPRNISAQRNWIRDNLVGKDEWFCMADDNISAFQIYPEPHYSTVLKYSKLDKQFKYLEKHWPPITELPKVIDETIAKAEEIGARFCGFSNADNWFYRNSKWRTVALICSKFCIMKNDDLRYDENITTMDDYEFSLRHMRHYGKVLVNAYAYPKAGHNQRGGLGPLSERGERKVADCKLIMERYPGWCKYKNRKNSLPEAEICLKSYNPKTVDKLRRQHGIT